MPAPVIYYIRHGETSWNAEGRLQGAQDIPLNDLGRKQAAHAGSVLAELLARDGRDSCALPFVASPLRRARATMELVRSALNLPPEKYALDDRLREIGYGVWEGSTLAEMQAADPVLYAKRLTAKWTMAPEGGETYAEVAQRIAAWHASLNRDMVVTAHGGTARALAAVRGVAPPEEAVHQSIDQGVVYVFAENTLARYA